MMQARRTGFPQIRLSTVQGIFAGCALWLGVSPALIGVACAEPQGPAAPAAKPAAKSSALDDALLEDLDNELLDGVRDLPAAKKPGTEKPAGEPQDESTDADMTDESALAAPEEGEEPLMRIGRQMRIVERRIDARRSADKTHEMQDQILADLDELIKKIQEQAQQQNSSSSKSSASQASSRDEVKQPDGQQSKSAGTQASNQPARQSSERLGKNKTEKPDGDAVKGLLKDAWGQLPPHTREQMLQSPPEQFLPKYELLIEKYYKRLAEEQKPRP